jgi:cytochrome c6
MSFPKLAYRLLSILVVLWLSLVYSPTALALASPSASPEAQLFEIHCAGCHPHGGNIIRRGKSLQTKALQRNGYTDIPTIASLIRQGKGNMSAFADRLSVAETDALAAYVLTQAEQGWR